MWLVLAGGWSMENNVVTSWDMTLTYHIIFDGKTLTTAYDRVDQTNGEWIRFSPLPQALLKPSPPHLSLSNKAKHQWMKTLKWIHLFHWLKWGGGSHIHYWYFVLLSKTGSLGFAGISIQVNSKPKTQRLGTYMCTYTRDDKARKCFVWATTLERPTAASKGGSNQFKSSNKDAVGWERERK